MKAQGLSIKARICLSPQSAYHASGNKKTEVVISSFLISAKGLYKMGKDGTEEAASQNSEPSSFECGRRWLPHLLDPQAGKLLLPKQQRCSATRKLQTFAVMKSPLRASKLPRNAVVFIEYGVLGVWTPRHCNGNSRNLYRGNSALLRAADMVTRSCFRYSNGAVSVREVMVFHKRR